MEHKQPVSETGCMQKTTQQADSYIHDPTPSHDEKPDPLFAKGHLVSTSCNTAELNGKQQFHRGPEKPCPLVFIADNFPDELRPLRTWICWDYEFEEGNWRKIPKNPHTGKNGQTNNPKTWGGLCEAVAAAERYHFCGVAIVLTRNRELQPIDLIGIDLDNCRNPVTHELTPEALEIIRRFSTYCEVSPSQTGVKLLCKSSTWPGKSDGQGSCGHNFGNVEIYREKFWCMTGHCLSGSRFNRGVS